MLSKCKTCPAKGSDICIDQEPSSSPQHTSRSDNFISRHSELFLSLGFSQSLIMPQRLTVSFQW